MEQILFIAILLLFILFVKNIFISADYDNTANKQEKGQEFETYIYNILITFMDINYIYKNVYIKRKNGRLTEIDIIAVHQTGIYVFECKNYNGWIFGNGNKKIWYQTYKTGDKYKFYNPIFQNEIHIKAAKNLLKNLNIPYYSIIIFNDTCSLQNIKYDNSNTFLIYASEVNTLLPKLISSQCYLNQINIDNINKILKNTYIANKDNTVNHIEDIYSGVAKCPYCNGNLVERINKKNNNKFYGCSNYPRCKYTTKYIRKII